MSLLLPRIEIWSSDNGSEFPERVIPPVETDSNEDHVSHVNNL
jgi:hypothetical protein